MPELSFNIDQIKSEMHGITGLAGAFLGGTSQERLSLTAHALPTAVRHGVWQIPREQPIETIPATCEAGELIGQFSFKWEVAAVPRSRFRLTGISSTRLEILESQSKRPLIAWNNDIGNSGSPGSRFHVQMLLNGNSMDVPRLPSVLLTPADCLDFLLGELFQESWKRHQYERRSDTAAWREGVRKRIVHFLKKKAERADTRGDITPWMNLKTWDLDAPDLTFE